MAPDPPDRPLPPTKNVRVRRKGESPTTSRAPTPQVRFKLTAPYDRTIAWMKSGGFALADRSYEIGRDPRSDLVLGDASVSARHAKLTPHAEGYELTDLGSTNGTTVNGRLVTGSQVLHGGETIGIGDVVLRVQRLDAS